MLLAIVAIWAIVIPVAILAVSWQAANLREERALRAAARSIETHHRAAPPVGGRAACTVRAARPRRTITRRVCPEFSRGARRRPASA